MSESLKKNHYNFLFIFTTIQINVSYFITSINMTSGISKHSKDQINQKATVYFTLPCKNNIKFGTILPALNIQCKNRVTRKC